MPAAAKSGCGPNPSSISVSDRRFTSASRQTGAWGCRRELCKVRFVMMNAKVVGLRGVELGVTHLDRAAAFYRCVWGLEPVASEGDTIHLRANGSEHHVVTLRERPKASFLGIHFAACDRAAVDALHDKAKGFGAGVTSAPAELPRSAG